MTGDAGRGRGNTDNKRQSEIRRSVRDSWNGRIFFFFFTIKHLRHVRAGVFTQLDRWDCAGNTFSVTRANRRRSSATRSAPAGQYSSFLAPINRLIRPGHLRVEPAPVAITGCSLRLPVIGGVVGPLMDVTIASLPERRADAVGLMCCERIWWV